MKPKLLIAIDAFDDGHVDWLADAVADWATCERLAEGATTDEHRAAMADAEIMIGWPAPEQLADSPLRLLLLGSAGYEEYQTPELQAKDGFVLCNAAGVYSDSVAEHCLAMMMALTRRLPHYITAMPAGAWRPHPGHDQLAGAVACVVGLGSLGLAVARRCTGMGMGVVGVRRHPERPSPAVGEVFGPHDLQTAVRAADHVILALPGGPDTEGLFGREVFEAMKPGAYFYNVGRGGAVDEQELIDRLRSGRLDGAGLDVFAAEPLPADSPLWGLENCIVTPHVAGYTADHTDKLCELMVSNLCSYRSGAPLRNVVDLGADP